MDTNLNMLRVLPCFVHTQMCSNMRKNAQK